MLVACSQENVPNAIDAPSKPTVEFTQQVSTLKTQVEDLRKAVRRVEFKQQSAEDRYKTASFDPTDTKFQRIDTDLGAFAVSVEDVRQFADGVKVKLRLGNLTSATFADVKLNLRYGPREPEVDGDDYLEKYDAWDKAIKMKEESIMTDIKPGHWNPVSVVLPGIAQNNFGFLEVGISSKRIALY